jgi:hypothetical protein
MTTNAILRQYSNSPSINYLIDGFNLAIDPTPLYAAFYDVMWNVDTAQGEGLDNWGRIVGVPRFLEIIEEQSFFGFDLSPDPQDFTPFNDAPFYSASNELAGYKVSDPVYRQMIKAKAYANIGQTNVWSLNRFLALMFSGRRAYVVDNADMSLTYKFEFALTSIELSIVTTTTLLPRPTGAVLYYQLLGGSPIILG